MSHYFTNDHLPSEQETIQTTILSKKFSFITDKGVFSKKRVDFGTMLLIESLPINKLNGRILDIGCGYGPIGIVVASFTNTEVVLTDVNKRALHLAKRNAKLNKVDNVEIIESYAYQNITGKFNTIITNPPIRAGKEVVYEIIAEAREHLLLDGELYIVIRKNQGAKSMIKNLDEFYQVDVINKKKDFLVLRCKIKTSDVGKL